MKRLAIIGAGDLGQLLAYHAIDSNYTVVGYFDDFAKVNVLIDDVPVIGSLNDIERFYNSDRFDEIIIAIGYKHIEFRKKCFLRFNNLIPFANIIHSSTYIDKSVLLGTGIFILTGCILERNVQIGDNILINTGATIAHDSVVSDHSFLSPRVAIAGFCSIGECCIIGINSTIIDNIMITNNVCTGGGTVVTKSIETSGLYVGNPARFIR